MWTKESLLELVETRMKGHKFILVSNREPYIHRFAGTTIECERPASGLTLALDPIMRACGGVWIAHGSGDADQEVVGANDKVRVPPENPSFTLRRVWLTREQELGYYYGLANQGLWPLCHNVFKRPVFEARDWEAYREVNNVFADAVLQEAGDAPAFVFIQDFHFALLPRMLKDRNPNLVVAQFWHIPWPNSEVFRGFPWKEELIDGMLGNDLLGFHLRLHSQNFLGTVDDTLEAKADRERFEITRNGKTTVVRPFPISIDFEAHSARAQTPDTWEAMKGWVNDLGIRTELIGIGVDRIDYTKGIAERFRAIDKLLARYPEYIGNFVFVQVAVPSRSRIQEYKMLEESIKRLAEEINWKWSAASWHPIVLLTKHFPQSRLTALHLLSRFCIVSSLHDGMNLVSKEYVTSRWDEDGILILSEFAGASRELTDAIVVNPFSEDQLTEAIRIALRMHPQERKRRMQKMRKVVAENNIYRWIGKIISALLKFEVPAEDHAAVAKGSM